MSAEELNAPRFDYHFTLKAREDVWFGRQGARVQILGPSIWQADTASRFRQMRSPDLHLTAFKLSMQDFLPSALHATFMTLVTEFLWLPWQAAMQGLEKGPSQGGSQVRCRPFDIDFAVYQIGLHGKATAGRQILVGHIMAVPGCCVLCLHTRARCILHLLWQPICRLHCGVRNPWRWLG